MKKDMTIEQYMEELEAKKVRAEVFKDVIRGIDYEIKWQMKTITISDGYYEEYTDEDGEVKKKWHSPVYEKDENGEEIRIPPEKDDYSYEKYNALIKVKDEILAIV